MPAQEPLVAGVERPAAPVVVRPYKAPTVPPVRLKNSDRLHSLIRAGKLYLTVQDAIALAIENNLDLEVDRYGPLVAEWHLERRQAGGPLRGVTAGNSFVNQATSGQGVEGSQVSAGLGQQRRTDGGGSGGNAVVSQIGPVTPNLDPVLQNTTALLAHHHSAAQHDAEPDHGAGGHPAHLQHVRPAGSADGRLRAGRGQQIVSEGERAHRHPESVGRAGRADFYFRHNFLNGFGRGREQPVHPRRREQRRRWRN